MLRKVMIVVLSTFIMTLGCTWGFDMLNESSWMSIFVGLFLIAGAIYQWVFFLKPLVKEVIKKLDDKSDNNGGGV